VITLNKENILGIDVNVTTYEDLKLSLINNIEKNEKSFIVAINPEKILKSREDKDLKELLNKATYQIPDGIGVIYASKLKKGNIKSRITGIDCMDMLCNLADEKEYKVFLYEAYHQVYSYTGYELDKLEEKNGTYYTESGENILDLVDKAVEDSGKVPKEFKQQMKNWIHDLVSTMSTKGWNNVPDMTLSILYGKSGLKDMNQLITYQYEADSTNRQWYSVL